MSREERAQAQEEQRERATRQATDLIRAYRDDPDAWVRLLFTAGMGDEAVYHFDVYWPTQKQDEQTRVVVQHVAMGRWTATFVGDPLATSIASSAG
ncbi:MAG TPA: hypothetical protein VFS83_19885 [Ktedonobacterales bacterium]|nr:hypothetical protein [Ktedonobacterales bacterium]